MRFLLRIVKRFLLWVLICLSAIALLEGSLRLAFINRSSHIPLVVEKEVSDFVLRGNSTVSLRPGKAKNGLWRGNKAGFRGPELAVSSNYRVMVYGDETVHTGHIPYESSIAPVLQQRVKTSLGKDIDVINAGVPGLGPDQVLERLEADIKAYAPKAIIVVVNTHNDYGDIIRNRRVYLDDKNQLKRTSYKIEGIKSERPFFSDYVIQSFFVEMMKKRGTIKTRDQFDLSSYNATPITLEKRLEDEMNTYQLDRVPNTSVFDDVYDLDVAVDTRSSASLVKVSLMQAVLRDIYKICDRHNLDVLFVLVPSATDLLVEPVIDYKDLKASYESYMRVNLTRPLTLYLQRNNYPVINLFPGFYKFGAKDLYDTEYPLLLSETGVRYLSDEIISEFLKHTLK